MPRVAKPKPAPDIDLSRVDEDLSAFAAEKVKSDPRGAPVTLPAPFCVLDEAHVNSVLTVLHWPGQKPQPVCQTPSGEIPVPSDDWSWSLPVLAEIRKKAPQSYVARQLDDPNGFPPIVASSAVECIRQFKKHFHGAKE